MFLSDGNRIFIEAVFPFNQSRTPPRLVTLDYGDAKEFGRRLMEAVHLARTQLVVTSGVRITINVVPNGYHLQIGAATAILERGLHLARLPGLLRIVDLIVPVESN